MIERVRRYAYKAKTRRQIACITKENTQSNYKGSTGWGLVELIGFEPMTYSLRTNRATNCAIAPYFVLCFLNGYNV